jgi:hypothetical protein
LFHRRSYAITADKASRQVAAPLCKKSNRRSEKNPLGYPIAFPGQSATATFSDVHAPAIAG